MSITQNQFRPPVNPLIIDKNNYDTKIIIEIDTITGNSRIRIEGKPLTNIQLLVALSAHMATYTTQIAIAEAKQNAVPPVDPFKGGM
jgi:hypothetical protein